MDRWVGAALAGDGSAYAQIIATYQRPVYSLCLRMLGNAQDAEDAAQETFLKAYRALAHYDASRALSSWLLSIAAHHCIDRLRRRRLPEVSLDALPPWRWIPARGGIDPEESAARADRAARIEALLSKLPADYRLVIILRYWHDLGYAEIAEVLSDTESAVKSRLHRARGLLAEALERDMGAAPGPGARPERHRAEARTADQGGIAWSIASPTA